MNKKQQILVAILLLLSILAVLLIVFRKKDTEKFLQCVCSSQSGGRGRVCQDTEEVAKQYYEKGITEYSNFPSKGWSQVSPGELDFPVSTGCGWDKKQRCNPEQENYEYRENQPYEGKLIL